MNPSTNIRNPANWLLDVWSRLPRDNETGQKSVMEGWIRALEVTGAHSQAISAVNSLYANVHFATDCVSRLNLSEPRKEQLLRWRPAFSGSLDDLVAGRRWQHALNRFTPELRVHLEYCGTAIDDQFPEHSTLSDLETLIAAIESLQKRLSGELSLDAAFRALIHDLFETIRRACAEYLVRGEKGIADSLSSIMSALMKYSGAFDSPEKKEWGEKVWSTAQKAANVTTITGVPLYVCFEAASKLLGNG